MWMVRVFFSTSDVKSILGSIKKRHDRHRKMPSSRQACCVSAVRPRESQATPDGHQYGQESVPHKREKAAPDAICIHSQKKESSIDGIEISLKLNVAKWLTPVAGTCTSEPTTCTLGH